MLKVPHMKNLTINEKELNQIVGAIGLGLLLKKEIRHSDGTVTPGVYGPWEWRCIGSPTGPPPSL